MGSWVHYHEYYHSRPCQRLRRALSATSSSSGRVDAGERRSCGSTCTAQPVPRLPVRALLSYSHCRPHPVPCTILDMFVHYDAT